MERHTNQTDWLAGLDTSADTAKMANEVRAKVAKWVRSLSDMVMDTPEEFAIQAEGQASLCAGAYGEAAGEAREAFMAYASHLRSVTSSVGSTGLTAGENCSCDPLRTPTNELCDFCRDLLADEPYCNHDAAAVVDGVCECGERVKQARRTAAEDDDESRPMEGYGWTFCDDCHRKFKTEDAFDKHKCKENGKTSSDQDTEIQTLEAPDNEPFDAKQDSTDPTEDIGAAAPAETSEAKPAYPDYAPGTRDSEPFDAKQARADAAMECPNCGYPYDGPFSKGDLIDGKYLCDECGSFFSVPAALLAKDAKKAWERLKRLKDEGSGKEAFCHECLDVSPTLSLRKASKDASGAVYALMTSAVASFHPWFR